MVKAKQWILKKHFSGEPKDEDMELVEVELPELKENEIRLETINLSIDPYMRPYSARYSVPEVMIGENLAKVVETRNDKFPVGKIVLTQTGWRTAFNATEYDLNDIPFELGNTPASHCLGALGMPGATAYFGLYRLCDPQPGETVIVNGAAGAVGNIVGQLAKIRGCTVIAFAGSDDKVSWLKDDLKFDHVFNYKKVDLSESITKVCPYGANVFFDNVGGESFHTIVNKHMTRHGRVLCCGSIENYNDKETKRYPPINFSVVQKELKIQGILAHTYVKEWAAAFKEMNGYFQNGQLVLRETLTEGFENMQSAFYGLFKGENIGKAIIQV